MNTMTLDQRESRVMDFINSKNKELQKVDDMNSINSNPVIQLRKLKEESQKGVSICLDTLLGKIYKDALPMDDPNKNCSDDEARDEIRNYIANRTNGHNSEWYIREAIKKNNSSTLKGMLAEAVALSKKFYNEKAEEIGKINVSDLNFNPNLNSEDIDKITRKLDLEEISEIIHQNVQKSIDDEVEKSKREDEYQKELEAKLTADTSVQDTETMEKAIEKYHAKNNRKIYQPSLFEAIMLGKMNVMKESTNEDIFSEAVHEYTKLSMTKALRLESFTVDGLRKLANSYLLNK